MGYKKERGYRLEPLAIEAKSKTINPVYTYYKIMGTDLSEAMKFSQAICPTINLPVLTGREDKRDLLTIKKQLVKDVCLDCQIPEKEMPLGLGVKKVRRDLREITQPVIKVVSKRLRGEQQEELTDYVARLYNPERKLDLTRGFTTLAEFFHKLQMVAQRTRLKLPQNNELLAFIQQLTEGVLGESRSLTMFAIACPRFGENDEYNRLEVGVSQTARTYLNSLPKITELLVKYQIPFKGTLLVNDTEDELLGGALLRRLGLTPERYHDLCQGNVAAIQGALKDFPSHLRENLNVSLFTEFFPQFKGLVRKTENRFYQLMQEDSGFYETMVATAKKRFERHQKILGGSTDFDKHLYLTLHYAAEYMVFGYLCRKVPAFNGSSFIVNYNSPNVVYFNRGELLAKTIQGEPNPEDINPIPVFQVKFYQETS